MKRFDADGAIFAPVARPAPVPEGPLAPPPRGLARLIARLRFGGGRGPTDAERFRAQAERHAHLSNVAPLHTLAAGGRPIFMRQPR
ncbi:MAG: hypothetical protein QNJ13_02345 [Paracoccaceae bacterium]|nr:hypothetical protein [Paracoccaceae bacterium]